MAKNQNNNIEGFEGEFLHPSFDIKGEVLILGFRYISKSREEKEVFLITGNGIFELFSDESFEYRGAQYFLEKGGRKLARIEKVWSLQELKKFVEDYNSGKTGIMPDPREVYGEIKELLKKYIELEKEADYSLLTAWVIGSYFFPAFSSYPFFHVKAPKRSGKSQCLNLLKELCFNAIKARPSFAALGDTVDSLKGVCLIDQADSLKRRGNEDLVDILADSYKKGGGKRRIIDMEKGRKILEFETYGPKAFASVGELPEDLRDRCIIIPLLRSGKNFPEPNEEGEDWRKIRGELYKLSIGNYEIVRSIYIVKSIGYRNDPEIIGRELELWLPLQVIFEMCSESETEEARKRFRHLYGFAEYEPSELEEEVFKALLEFLKDEKEIILSPKIISEEMDFEVFPDKDSSKQRAARVGWTIKKFNLASEKRVATRKGVSYLFKKEAVEKIYKSYFKAPLESDDEPTSPIPDSEIALN